MLFAEDAQSRLRAENGIKEKIIGFIGSDVEFYDTYHFPNIAPIKVRQLPDDLQWVFWAEQHRMRTGELMTIANYKKKFPNGPSDGG